MASVSASHVILFIAAVAVAVMLAGTATGVANDVSTAIRDTGDDYAETLDTNFAIISDPGSNAIYNETETTVTLLVKNTGTNVLSTNPNHVDTLIDGQFVQETDITVLDGDYWRPGNVARITLNTTIDNGAHRVIVRSNEQRSLLTFPFYGSGSDLEGNVAFAGSINVLNNSGAVTAYLTDQDLSTNGDASVNGLGPPTADFDNDGGPDVPYVNSSGVLKVAYSNGSVDTVPGQPYSGGKTRLSIGSWNGSDPSILFGNSTGIYRVRPGGQPQAIRLNVKANGVSGVADVDGDRADELVFIQQNPNMAFLDDDGSVNSNGYSLNTIEIGPPVDFDGDGVARIPYRGTSGYVSLAGFSSESWTKTELNSQEKPLKQLSMSAHDMDGDGQYEVVFANGNSNIAYMDLNGSITVPTNASGDPIPVDAPGIA